MEVDHSPQWYAIRVKSNREGLTAKALQGKDYEVFLPVYHQCRSSPRGGRTVAVPLFAGYVFCRFDAQNRLPILTVPGVVHIVGFGNVPYPVDAGEMNRVMALTQSQLRVMPHPYLAVGQRVRLHGGPLRGIDGIILSHQGEHRLVVSISLLQRSIAVPVDRDWASPSVFLPNTA
jgi:transcription antitermination factor NusG